MAAIKGRGGGSPRMEFHEPVRFESDIRGKGAELSGLYPVAPVSKTLLSRVGAYDAPALESLEAGFSEKYWRRVIKILGLVAEHSRPGQGGRLHDYVLRNRGGAANIAESVGRLLLGKSAGGRIMDSQAGLKSGEYVVDECGHFSAIMDLDAIRGEQGRVKSKHVVGELPDYMADRLLRRLFLMVASEHESSKPVKSYPAGANPVAEVGAGFTGEDCAGQSRKSYPNVAALISLKNPDPSAKLRLDFEVRGGDGVYRTECREKSAVAGLSHVWGRLIEHYPLEEAALFLDLFSSQPRLAGGGCPDYLEPAITAVQAYSRGRGKPLKLKMLNAGGGGAIVLKKPEDSITSVINDDSALVDAAKESGFRDFKCDAGLLSGEWRQSLIDHVLLERAGKEGFEEIPSKPLTTKQRSRLVRQLSDAEELGVEYVHMRGLTGDPGHLGSQFQSRHTVSEITVPDRCSVVLLGPHSARALSKFGSGMLEELANMARRESRSLVGALKQASGLTGELGENQFHRFEVDKSRIGVVRRHRWRRETEMRRPQVKALISRLSGLSGGGGLDLKLQFGHIHSDRPAGKEQLMTAKYSGWLAERLRGEGFAVEPLTLVDNLHVPDVIDYGKYRESLGKSGLTPERYVLEDALPIGVLAVGVCQKMLASKGLKDRVRKVGGSVHLELDDTNVALYEGVSEKDGVWRGRVACVPFNWACDYYLHNTQLVDKEFFRYLEKSRPDSELLRLHRSEPGLSYHELVLKHVYGVSGFSERQARKDEVVDSAVPPFNHPGHDFTGLVDGVFEASRQSDSKPAALYVIEGFYLAQWDKYKAFKEALSENVPGVPELEVLRFGMDFGTGSIQALSINSGDILEGWQSRR